MNAPPINFSAKLRSRRGAMLFLVFLGVALLPQPAHASLFQGEALDTVANVMSWLVLFIVPIVVISVFWLVHILPEKIAHKKRHPQTKAIQCLCLLSLFFGGLLWPLAWLWAYSKPVMHKLAYGTDVDDSHDDHVAEPENETEKLRARVAELENQLNRKGAV
ncbi:MAG TPA: DUF3302 domain-containing protein [Chthoniobacterales bacterium]|nr:DUF3302 domain-containing protein [Chthoniobacterales bacterium]